MGEGTKYYWYDEQRLFKQRKDSKMISKEKADYFEKVLSKIEFKLSQRNTLAILTIFIVITLIAILTASIIILLIRNLAIGFMIVLSLIIFLIAVWAVYYFYFTLKENKLESISKYMKNKKVDFNRELINAGHEIEWKFWEGKIFCKLDEEELLLGYVVFKKVAVFEIGSSSRKNLKESEVVEVRKFDEEKAMPQTAKADKKRRPSEILINRIEIKDKNKKTKRSRMNKNMEKSFQKDQISEFEIEFALKNSGNKINLNRIKKSRKRKERKSQT